MMINTNTIVSVSEANQNFSRAPALALQLPAKALPAVRRFMPGWDAASARWIA